MGRVKGVIGFDRRAASCTFTAVIILLTLYVVYLVRSTLFVFVLAILFAYLLSPLVNFLDRFLPGGTRATALVLASVIFIGTTGLFVSQIGARVVEQAEALNKRLPNVLASWQQPLPAVTPAINALLARPLRAEG